MAVRIIRAIAIMARFLPEDSLLQGVNPAQQYKRLELENGEEIIAPYPKEFKDMIKKLKG